jgi:hypothetical protein
MRIRGTEVSAAKDYDPIAHMDSLRKQQEKIDKIKSAMPRGTNLYIRRRQKAYSETKKG